MTTEQLCTDRDSRTRRARELVMRYGWNVVSYQILNPGMLHWFSADCDAVVGYVERHGVWVVGGAPICEEERVGEVVEEFELAARRKGCRVCYFGAAERLYDCLASPPAHSVLALGAQPVWDPSCWSEILASRASLRAQLYRSRNKGVIVAEWTAAQAHSNVELQRCLREWLASRPMPAMHFLVEPETLACLDDRRIFVAAWKGVPVGFLIASPVPRRNGWLVEQIIRGRSAPNGTNELLLDAAMCALAMDGSHYVTLGLVPLSSHTMALTPRHPFWLHFLLVWVRAHGKRFYNFDGLEKFKTKFAPQEWEPIFAISNEPVFSMRTLYAIGAAFSDRSPMSQVGRGLLKAIIQEVIWLRRRILRKRHPAIPPPTLNASPSIDHAQRSIPTRRGR